MRYRVRQFFLQRPLWLTIPVMMAVSVAASVGMLFLLNELMGLGYPPSFRRSLMVATIAPMLVSGPIGGTIVHLLREVEAARQAAQQLAWNDALTGLLNRRRMVDLGEREVALAARNDAPLAAVLLDVDDFKKVNDAHGHAAGDAVLQAVGKALPRAVRSTDLCARWGGEEFALLLLGANAEEAAGVSHRVREVVAGLAVPAGGNVWLRCTASVGVAEWRPGDSLDTLISRADAAMYSAKSKGKNRVHVAEAA